MRVTFCHLISLAVLFSSVFVSAGPTPDTCSSCWIAERNKLTLCQNLPQAEIDEFSKLTDEQIVDKQNDFPKLIPCLCALVPNVPSILNKCNCNADDSKGLTKESQIVKTLCTKVIDDPTPKPAANTTTNTTTTTAGNKPKNDNKPADGSGDDSTPGDASTDGYNSNSTTSTTGSSSNSVPATSAAISAQWAGSFIVTLGAVGVALAL